jgi:hypothetical protein
MNMGMYPTKKDQLFNLERAGRQLVRLNIENNATCWSTAAASVLGETPMTNSKEKAVEFRRQAALYREVAARISLKEDRERMMEVAERLLELARRAEAETDQAGSN